MADFREGDPIRIDIPNETDFDHETYHGVHGTIVDVLDDDADEATHSTVDGQLFRVELDSGEIADFRRRDLRPPLE